MSKIISKIKMMSMAKKVTAIVVAVVLVGGAVTGGVYYSNKTKQADAKVEQKKKPEKKEKKIEQKEDVAVSMTYDSMEKDINVYFTDAEDNKITDVEFAVKLVEQSRMEELNPIIEKLATAQKACDEYLNPQDAEEEKEKRTVENLTDDEKKEYDTLAEKKKSAVKTYAAELNDLDGTILKDDDKDGTISQTDLEPGEFALLFVPMEGYEANQYKVDATIKAEIEYKAVDVSKKKVAYSAKEDTRRHATVVETAPTDTVPYYESNSEEIPAEFGETTSVAAPIANPGVTSTMAIGSGTLTYPANASLYSDVAGQNSASVSVSVSETIQNVAVNSENSGVATISPNGDGTYLLQAVAAGQTNIIVSGTEVAGASPVSVSFPVKVVSGAGEPLKDTSGNQLYKSKDLKAVANASDYIVGQKYYYVVREAYTKYVGWQTIDGTRYYYDGEGNRVTGKQTIKGQTYNFGSDGALLTSGTGIDVSKWQGNIDWSQVKTVASFAIIRAGFRGSSGGIAEDPYAIRNIQGANANGVRVGLYFYSIAQNEAQAVEEASLAIEVARKGGTVSLPIYIDMEDSRQTGLSTAQRDAIVMAFCRTVQSAGYRAGVYANKNWYTNYLTPSSYPGDISIWYARYNDVPGYSGRFDIWQYTSKGSCPGISGNVDMNISYF